MPVLLEEIVMHNFGVYRGRHCIDLLPKAPDKPVILLGALNGAGKTTFLDALKLALYGKFASCSNRGSLSYPDFLRRTINHQVDAREGAGVELQFRHRRDGCEDSIRIVRTWRSTGKGLKETAEVLRNGRPDPVTTDRWYEYVEEFIPARVSNFFFFDGENVESLASEELSAELIRTGLHALLGLDLVDRASDDLGAIETRTKTTLAPAQGQDKLSVIQQHIMALRERQSEIAEKLASERSRLQNILNRINRLREDYRRDGGELFEQRDAIEAEAEATEHRLADAEGQLRDLAAGAAPLLLVRDLLLAACKQAEIEENIRTQRILLDTLTERDRKIIASLTGEAWDSKRLDTLEGLLARDLASRKTQAEGDTYLHVPREVFQPVNNGTLNKIASNIREKIAHTRKIRGRLSDLQCHLAAIPDPESLKDIGQSLQDADKQRREAELRCAVLERELDTHARQLAVKEEEHLRYLERLTEQDFADRKKRRVLHHSQKLRSTLSTFRHRVAEKHIKQLETLILESFTLLVRKPDLITRISIAPESYRITLYTQKGHRLPPDRLSAGERQLLAIAMLWGLAKSSGRPLPAVIDTPLGRLDSNHRDCLVRNYFPFASHQVLLLSTDEEIDEGHHSALRRFVAREYQIHYDHHTSSSVVKPGYFWKG